jgi:hypothetical protein
MLSLFETERVPILTRTKGQTPIGAFWAKSMDAGARQEPALRALCGDG